jgi:homogentisate 1,2-dioxygenase
LCYRFAMSSPKANYQFGFQNHFETEAIPGALPRGQNSPQKPAFGLYPEQINGTAFTAPRHRNLKSWLYKISPSVVQGKFEEVGHSTWVSDSVRGSVVKTPQALRFKSYQSQNSTSKDFIDSLFTYAINGSPYSNSGCAIHLFQTTLSMTDRYFYNSDAEMMIILESGELTLMTEMGILELSPLWIGVIPRGIKFKVLVKQTTATPTPARGYVCENFGSPFQLPELGPIGANGLAHARDFETPVAHFEELAGDFKLLTRYQGSVWQAAITTSPLNTVAWHGNYAPYRYDLRKFNTINTVTYDHPDPSIFTVLTSASTNPGTANIDFVIFPPRWMVAENTFRPPYYHRNFMNEFMGLIQGSYDAKPEGFLPGGASLHNCMTGHGPDADAFQKGTNAELKPERYQNTMAFMWESQFAFWPTQQVLTSGLVDENYIQDWNRLKPHFKSPQ